MARTPKEGLDYFPVVTKFEDKTELLIAEFGPSALGIVISLYQKIYANSCYINWDNDVLMLFARYLNTETTTINTVITRCFDRKILNKKLFDKYEILTSHGIQKQYLRVCKESRRKKVEMIKEYCLIKDCDLLNVITEFISINAEETPVNAAGIPINDSENTQSKVKKSKGNIKNTNIESKETKKHIFSLIKKLKDLREQDIYHGTYYDEHTETFPAYQIIQSFSQLPPDQKIGELVKIYMEVFPEQKKLGTKATIKANDTFREALEMPTCNKPEEILKEIVYAEGTSLTPWDIRDKFKGNGYTFTRMKYEIDDSHERGAFSANKMQF